MLAAGADNVVISEAAPIDEVVRAHQTPRGQAAAAMRGLIMAIWLLSGTVLTSIFAVGLVMVVVIAAKGPDGGPPDPTHPSFGQLVYLVVTCGLLGLPLLGSYCRAHRILQRRPSHGNAEPPVDIERCS